VILNFAWAADQVDDEGIAKRDVRGPKIRFVASYRQELAQLVFST
jgi:hypothetical protein